MCDFTTGFAPPEMVKRRPVVVISPRMKSRPGLCSVVPLSTTAPRPVEAYHCRVEIPASFPDFLQHGETWAKADMIAAVGLFRLDFVRRGKDRNGRRIYCYDVISREKIKEIRIAVAASIGLSH